MKTDNVIPLEESPERAVLMEELCHRYGKPSSGARNVTQQARFLWKQYAYRTVVGGVKVIKRGLDINLLFLTVPAVLFGRGAY